MQSSKVTKYLTGWEINFNDKEALTNFLQTQGVSASGFEFFKNVQAALELNMLGDVAIKVYKHDAEERKLIAENVELPINNWTDHEIFVLEKSTNGNHKIGGNIPKELIFPTHENLKTPFHYIATIDGNDPNFSWIGLEKLHIIFPLNECNMGIFLDYSNPNKPIILNPDTFNDAWYDPDLDNSLNVEFSEAKYSVNKEINDDAFIDNDGLLLCGAPLWYQMPEIPICPITKKVMKYICTINSDSEISLLLNETENKKLGFADYLCFGDHGHLFVFYCPESKVLHLNAQF
jgi:hypothetical protein